MNAFPVGSTTNCPASKAAAIVGYFDVNAYTGKYGLNARQELDQEIIALTSELAHLLRP